MTIEKSDRSTLGSRVASDNRIAADMQPSIIDKSFSSCFLTMHSQINSASNQHLFQEVVKPTIILSIVIIKNKQGFMISTLQVGINHRLKKVHE